MRLKASSVGFLLDEQLGVLVRNTATFWFTGECSGFVLVGYWTPACGSAEETVQKLLPCLPPYLAGGPPR